MPLGIRRIGNGACKQVFDRLVGLACLEIVATSRNQNLIQRRIRSHGKIDLALRLLHPVCVQIEDRQIRVRYRIDRIQLDRLSKRCLCLSIGTSGRVYVGDRIPGGAASRRYLQNLVEICQRSVVIALEPCLEMRSRLQRSGLMRIERQ